METNELTQINIGDVFLRGIVPVTVAGFILDGEVVLTDELNSDSFPGTPGIRRGTMRRDYLLQLARA